MKKVLLHICCGICSSGCVTKLREDGFEVSGFFYNPNIHPEDEYNKRLDTAREVAGVMGFELLIGEYEPGQWRVSVKGREFDPEGGQRCQICYRWRLERAARELSANGFDYLATTLSISPHKDVQVINIIGKSIAQGKFLEYDFKKKEGFKKANIFAKEHSLYRQHYCGCEFSLQR